MRTGLIWNNLIYYISLNLIQSYMKQIFQIFFALTASAEKFHLTSRLDLSPTN